MGSSLGRTVWTGYKSHSVSLQCPQLLSLVMLDTTALKRFPVLFSPHIPRNSSGTPFVKCKVFQDKAPQGQFLSPSQAGTPGPGGQAVSPPQAVEPCGQKLLKKSIVFPPK